MFHHINTIFFTGSQELADFLEKAQVGNPYGTGDNPWWIREVNQLPTPPHPVSGDDSVMVQLLVSDTPDEPLPEPPVYPPGSPPVP